jgi:hypothetical protein
MAIEKITNVDYIDTTDNRWWFIYNDETKIVLVTPTRCVGYTTSPHIMIIGDTEEELNQYIADNELVVENVENY